VSGDPPAPGRASLAGLAARYGVARAYRTDRGERVAVGRDTVVAVLDALGVDTTGRGWIARAIAAHDAARAARLVDPVLVAWDGHLSLPKGDLQITLEDGSSWQGASDDVAPLPHGYHELRVTVGARSETALVVSAPVRSWRRPGRARHWGVYAPLYALHHGRQPAPGDLGDLAQLIAWVGRHGGDTVLTLPLLAAFLDEPQEISPYSPVSRLMWNELYVALDRPPRPGTDDGLIDYRGAASATRAAIEAEAASIDADAFRSGELLQFVAARPDVTDYARFRAAQRRHGRNWRSWPAAMRDGEISPADVDPREVRYHVVAQWLADRQLATSALDARAHERLLGLDLAIGTHPDGYDVWRHRAVFATSANAGAPPDTFFVAGQDWGFPPIVPDAARRSGHAYFRRSIAHHLRHATLLRIDHVMGLRRLYWIPHGAAATAGTYVDYPAEELFAIVTLESHRAQAMVVGEDLGTVPPSVRRALRRHALIGTWVAQGSLEQSPASAGADPPPRRSVAALNTHDMPTFAGYVQGRDIDDRLALHQINATTAARQREERADVIEQAKAQLGAKDPQELLHRLVEILAGSDAEVVLVNLEDLWLEVRPQNVPGTSTERPNWRRPAAYAVDELDAVPAALETLARMRAARRVAGRRGSRAAMAPEP
jgi:4-alpha-glucanotransferase